MAKREKRLEKGIESIKKQIELHREKMRKAIEEGKIELAEYYSKEIGNLGKEKEHKEEKHRR